MRNVVRHDSRSHQYLTMEYKQKIYEHLMIFLL